jgi:hypothetical protein
MLAGVAKWHLGQKKHFMLAIHETKSVATVQ